MLLNDLFHVEHLVGNTGSLLFVVYSLDKSFIVCRMGNIVNKMKTIVNKMKNIVCRMKNIVIVFHERLHKVVYHVTAIDTF